MFKSSVAISLLALFCARFNLVQGRILSPSWGEEEEKNGRVAIDHVFLAFLDC
jgi:hypothetical protein